MTHGNSDSSGINWSENLPDKPSFRVGFQCGNSGVFGVRRTTQGNHDSFRQSPFRLPLHGFAMGAYFQYGGSHSVIPQLFTGTNRRQMRIPPQTVSASTCLTLCPCTVGFSANFTSSNFSNDDLGFGSSGTVDSITTNAGIQPTNKLHLSIGMNYSDNLGGPLYQAASCRRRRSLPQAPARNRIPLTRWGWPAIQFCRICRCSAMSSGAYQSFLGENVGRHSRGRQHSLYAAIAGGLLQCLRHGE